MSSECVVEFLGWSEPGLRAAARRLARHYQDGGALRMERSVVVTPGGRAGRRLAELLASEAEADGGAYWPGRIVTIGVLPELLFEAGGPRASAAARLAGWARALRSMDREELAALSPTLPEEADHAGWLGLGERLMRLQETLAGGGLRLADVAGRAEAAGLAEFDEQARWAALGAAEGAYETLMDEAGLIDPQTARLTALAERTVALDGELWLVGVAEMPTLVRRMVEALEGPVTALVQAPAALADRFDGLGTVIPEAWAEARLPVERAGLRVAEGPAGQAGAAVRAIAAAARAEESGKLAAEEITVGVCDEQVLPHTRRQLEAFGVPARVAEGRPVSRGGPCRLLEGVAGYLPGRRFGDFAALLRHPDLAWWLKGELSGGDEVGAEGGDKDAHEVGIDAWLRWVDEYYNDHLQQRLSAAWLGEGERAARMKRVYEAVHGEGLLGPLEGRRYYREWAAPIAGFLSAVYGGRSLNRGDERDRGVIESCEALARGLEELAELPAELDEPVGVAEAIGLLLRLMEGAAIAPESEGAAVELLGWLELPLDDAQCMVVTGLNEGRVPESVVGDAFLPDRLRTALGLIDNGRRYARDAYALSAIIESRSDVALVMGRRTGEGEPLMPSRLLFADEQSVVLERARWFYESQAEGEATLPASDAGEGGTAVFETPGCWPPPPPSGVEPPDSLRVTAFRDYLACPYRFYLRHVLGLEPIDDRAVELDAAGFGTLAHEVVRRFGHAAMAGGVDPSDEGGIRRWVGRELDRCFTERHGEQPAAALVVQREQLRQRLGDFAAWQADWAKRGHRIEQVELDVTDAAIAVDGEAMGLRGRIDRIDVVEETGERLLLDYKTSDRAKKPEKTHQSGSGDDREWVDLQLPLYRELAAARGIGPIGGVGYINLPRAAGGVEAAIAGWDEAALAEARTVAEEVVRAVRACRFYPPADPPPTFDAFAAICGVEQFVPEAIDELPEEDEEGEP